MGNKIRLGILVLMAVMLSGMTAFGQTLADYKFATGTDANMWKTLSSPTAILSTAGDNSVSSVQDIGFTFTFGATSYTQFSVNADGNLRFGSEATGYGSYSTPFSSSNAAVNSPKINFFGCDGYLPASENGGYVNYQLFGTAPNRVCVVEFATSTYNTNTRGNIYSWQVQLYERSNRILIVYQSEVPEVNPYPSRQVGMCTGADDIILVSASHDMTHYTSGRTTSIGASTWPDASRYYLFDPSVIPMELGLTYTGTLGTLGVWKTYTSCTYIDAGEEQVLSFTPLFSSSYLFTATKTSGDPDFFLMSSFGNTGTNVYGDCWDNGQITVSLTGGTTYYLVVENYKTSATSGYTISVQVAPATIPYTCSFDTDSDSGPWTFANGTQANHWMIGSDTYSSESSSLYITDDDLANVYSVTDESKVYAYRNLYIPTVGDYVVSFKWKGYGEGNYDYLRAFIVPVSVETLTAGESNGIVKTGAPSGWLAVDGGSKLNYNSDEWSVSSHEVSIETAGEYYLVFYWCNDYSYGTQPPIAVDDIEVAVPCTNMATISADVQGASSVEFTRTSGGDANYEILVSTLSNPAEATEDPVAMTSETMTVDGLLPSTQYYAFIRSRCSEYRIGEWSEAVEFTTEDIFFTLPYYENFESGGESNWTMENGANGWIVGTASAIGTTSLFISNGNGDSNEYDNGTSSTSYAYCKLKVEEPSVINVSFDWLVNGENKYDYLRAFMIPVSLGPNLSANVWNGVSYYGVPEGWIDVSQTGGQLVFSEDLQAQRSSADVVIQNSGLYYLVFVWVNDGSMGENPPASVDNISIEVLSNCMPVADINVEAGKTTASISWEAIGSATQWQVLVSQSSDISLATETPMLVSSTTHTVSNLTPDTQYYAYVRTYCSASEQSIWSDAVAFTTLPSCIPVEDVFINDYGKTWVSLSWTNEDAMASQWQVLVTESSSPEWAAETPTLVNSTSETIDGLEMNTYYYVYVRAYCSSSDQSSWTYGGAFTTYPPCVMPTDISVVVNSTSANLAWLQEYNLSDYHVYISNTEMSQTQLNALTSTQYTEVHGASYNVSGLTASRTYHFYVRAVCYGDELTSWAHKQFTTTNNEFLSLPYYQDFETDVLENWHLNNETNGWYLGSAVAYDGEESLYISMNNGVSHGYNDDATSYSYAYCLLNVAEPCMANVSFDWQAYGEPGYDFLRAFVIPASVAPNLNAGSDNGMASDSNDTPAGWGDVAQGGGELSNSNDWQHSSYIFDFSETGNYYLVFFWGNDYMSGSQFPAAVDNVSVVPLSEENDIVAFSFDGAENVVIDTDSHTVTCDVPYSLDLSTVYPEIVVSENATISPESGQPVNLESSFAYIVTSQAGGEQEWMVTVNRLPVNTDAEILSFWTDGILSLDINSENATVNATISRMYYITNVKPWFEVSSMATINYYFGEYYDFTNPVVFTVTAENGDQKDWTVSVAYGDSPLGVDCSNPYVVDAENDLPYSHSASTAGMYNMYNSYMFDYDLYMTGNEAVYRIDLPYMMKLDISVSSTSEGYGIFIMDWCGLNANVLDYKTNISYSESLIVDLPAGEYYVVVDTDGEDIDYTINISRIPYCYPINNIWVTRLQTELDVEWTSFNVDDNWTLLYGLEGFDIDSEGTQVTVSEPNYAITGLSESTAYDIYVRSNCSESGNSNWTQYTASTIASCQMPLDLAVFDVYDVNASMSWEGFNMTQWEVQYMKVGDSQYTSLTVSNPAVTLTGLQSSAEYNVRVRSVCDGSYSDFVETSFATECRMAREFPFIETFDGDVFPPECWSQERTEAGSGAGLGYSNGAWMHATSPVGDNSTPTAMLADARAGSVHNLISLGVLFAESVNGYDISLDVYRSSRSADSENEGVEIWVNSEPNIISGHPQKLGYISKNYTHGSEGVPQESAPGWYTYSFNDREHFGLNYVIIVGKANNAGGVYVDNLKIEKTVDCLVPYNLVAKSDGEERIQLEWMDANAVRWEWNVRYSLNGGDVVDTVVFEPSLTIYGLEQGTHYNISAEIQGICAYGMESDWYSETVEATTDCWPLSLPYSEDFNVADGYLPDCWKDYCTYTLIFYGDTYTFMSNGLWAVSNGVASGHSSASIESTSRFQVGLTHLLSPRFYFSDYEKYMLDFDVMMSSLNVLRPDSLYVHFLTEGNDTTIMNIAIQNASESGMVRMSVPVPQYSGVGQFDFVLDGYRECSIDNFAVRNLSHEADILTFELPGQTSLEINAETAQINASVVYGTDITALAPFFTISENASVDVGWGEVRDFSEPVVYVVTAEDDDYVREWTVYVTIDENSCPNPTVDDIDIAVAADSIVLTIPQVYNETSYNLKVSSQAFDPETETGDAFDGVVENVAVVTGLQPNTYYYIALQSNCDALDWTVTGFVTLCGVYELPYAQDFSDEVECWDAVDANDDGKTWTLDNEEAMYMFSRVNQADDYLVSPLLSLIRNAKLEFKYRVGNFSYNETFSVFVATDSDTTLLETMVVNNEEMRTFGPVDLSDFAGQVGRILIKCESAPYMYRLYVDDFSVAVTDYVLDVSAVGRGSVTPSGMVEVAPGESVEFAIAADEHNELLSLTLDGEDVTADIVDGTYTVSDVHEEHAIVATFTERYAVTASATEGGQIVTEGVTVLNRGESVSYVVIPDTNYRLASIIVDGEAVALEPDSYIYTIENVEADHNVLAVFERIIYHTVHIVAGDNGTVNPNGDVDVVEGENISLAVIPDEGYRIHAFVVDDEDVTEELTANGNTYTFENVVDDHNVSVSFIENTYYTITATCGEHGTITPSGEISVLSGENKSFAIVADGGYHIVSVTVDDVDVTSELSGSTYTFNEVVANHTIHAEFEINTYTVVVYAQGGTITPSGSITVNHGDSLSFEFTPNEEYELMHLLVDNQSVEVEGNTFVLDSITSDHVLVAVFVPMNVVRHEIVATAGEHGSIMPGGRVRVIEGENQNFQIVPDEHYYISSLTVDGTPVDVADEYLFENVTENHTISATFDAYKRVVTVIAGEHGSVTPSGEVDVDEGSSLTLEFDPNVGYMVSEVLVDGESVEFSGNSYTLENVLEDHTVNVNFGLLPMWAVTAVVGAHGTIEPEGTNYVLNGDPIEFTFVPDEGYMQNACRS